MKLDSAKWFVQIRQRQETFYTMNAIMHYQEDYFDGDETKVETNDPERHC
jgi:RNA polymerase sigma-54 factor